MIVGDHAQFQDMLAGLDAVQRSAAAFEHAHQFAVDVGVGVMALFAFGQFETERNLIAAKGLIVFGC